MLNYKGLFLPDGETHLVEWMEKINKVVDGKPTYQYHKLEAALKHVKQFRTAVDVGAHCGLWSMHLVKKFKMLHAFEPMEAHRQCFVKNLDPKYSGVQLHHCALGFEDSMVTMHTSPHSSGDTWVNQAQGGDTPLKTLDGFNLQMVDFVKLDCEGYELFALQGGEKTILRDKPCIIVEQKPGRAQKWGLEETQAVIRLQDHGAKLRDIISGDFILSWD